MAKLIVMHPFHSFSAAEAMEVLWRRWTWNMSEVRFVWICTDCRTAEAHWEYISLFRSNLVYATALCQSSERAMYKVWFYQLILCSFAKGAYNHHSRALPQFERKQRMARTTTAKYWKQRSEYGRGGARRKTNVSTSSAVNYYMALASLMLNVDAHTVRRTPWLIRSRLACHILEWAISLAFCWATVDMAMFRTRCNEAKGPSTMFLMAANFSWFSCRDTTVSAR